MCRDSDASMHQTNLGVKMRTIESPPRTALRIVLFIALAAASLLVFTNGWNACVWKFRGEHERVLNAAGRDYDIAAGFGFIFGVIPLIVMFVFVAAALTWTLLSVCAVRLAIGLAVLSAAAMCGTAYLIAQMHHGGPLFDLVTYSGAG